ncbi:unnamed protein product, partial [Amoebophrya sp. A25]
GQQVLTLLYLFVVAVADRMLHSWAKTLREHHEKKMTRTLELERTTMLTGTASASCSASPPSAKQKKSKKSKLSYDYHARQVLCRLLQRMLVLLQILAAHTCLIWVFLTTPSAPLTTNATFLAQSPFLAVLYMLYFAYLLLTCIQQRYDPHCRHCTRSG